MKVRATFHILIEYTGKNSGHGMIPVEGTTSTYVRYMLSQDRADQTHIIPFMISQSNILRDKERYSDYLHREVQRILNKNVMTSNTKYICITGITFTVFRLRNTGFGDFIPGYEDLYNSRNRDIFT
jgi:CRISPR/Cas system CMR-associated protein Cmr3 (group 5 of RAMP superfamily)